MSASPDDIHQFWFGDIDSDGRWDRGRSRRWFRGEPAFDALVATEFQMTLELAWHGELDHWRSTPRGQLALILLFDQFAQHVYRGRPEAFRHDALALALSNALINTGDHLTLHPIERLFVYLPLEHSEDLHLQDICMGLLVDLAMDAPPHLHNHFRQYVRFALKHREIIERFGRYPHRNAVLGRPSTAEELAFLRDGGETFTPSARR